MSWLRKLSMFRRRKQRRRREGRRRMCMRSSWWKWLPECDLQSFPQLTQHNREESSQPAAAVKPIQEQPVKSSKGGNVAKLASFYADKISEIKVAKAAKLKEEKSKEPWGFTTIYVFSFLSLLNCKSTQIMNHEWKLSSHEGFNFIAWITFSQV